SSGYLKYHDNSIWADFRSADPGFFELFPPRVVAGNPDEALKRPNTLVITRRFARRLFGREDVVGQTVTRQLFQMSTLQIRAVIEDLPSNTQFTYDVVMSHVGLPDDANALTYLKLRAGTGPERLRQALPDFTRRHMPEMLGGQPVWQILDLKLIALRDLHFLPS